MVRKLLATTAIATLIATGAYAQTTTQPAPAAPSGTMQPGTMAPSTDSAAPAPMMKKAEGHLASNIIGETVYNSAGDDAENIGEVNDIVLAADGSVKALIVGVGGFLGIGEKNVALEYSLAKWQTRDNDEFIVIETTADALKALPEFETAAYEMQPADADVAETKPATAEELNQAQQAAAANNATTETAPNGTAPANDTMAQAPATTGTGMGMGTGTTAPAADQTAQAPATDQTATAAINRDELDEVAMDQIRSEDFVGTTVYGANDQNVGEVGDVIMTADGKVDAVVLDVGGFLGIGEKEVAVGLDNLTFMKNADGDMYVYTSLTKEQLEAQAAYDETGYQANRDSMRMVVPN